MLLYVPLRHENSVEFQFELEGLLLLIITPKHCTLAYNLKKDNYLERCQGQQLFYLSLWRSSGKQQNYAIHIKKVSTRNGLLHISDRIMQCPAV